MQPHKTTWFSLFGNPVYTGLWGPLMVPLGLGRGPRPGAVAHTVTGIKAVAQGSGMLNWLMEDLCGEGNRRGLGVIQEWLL